LALANNIAFSARDVNSVDDQTKAIAQYVTETADAIGANLVDHDNLPLPLFNGATN
jgi:hypothetical protein